MKKRVLALAFVVAVLAVLALAGCSTQASSSSAESASSEAASASAASASSSALTAAESTVPSIGFNGVPTASFQPINNFTEPGEMSDADAEKADRAIRAYEPKQESLLVNKAKSFYYHDQLDANTKSLYEGLMTLVEDPTTTDHVVAVTLKSQLDMQKLEDTFYLAMFSIQYDHPELFWMYNGIETSIIAKVYGNKVYFLLEKPYKNYEKEMKAFNEAADKFLADIDVNASDAEKALAIHDKLCSLVTYDDDVAAKTTKGSDLAHTAYGALVANSSGKDNLAVCDGYSLAYEYLLQQVGIEATVMVGEGGASPSNSGPHAWSLVKLDGDWYEVDSTWDDGMTEYKAALEEAKKEDPKNEALPYYEKALADEDYYKIITHYQYNLTTKQFSDYTPPAECTYTFEDGAALTLPTAGFHKRACDLEGYAYYDTLTKLAPEAKGTKHAYKAK